MRPLLAITMGDVAGVGPEIVAKSLAHREVYQWCRPLVVGDAAILARNLRFIPKEAGEFRLSRVDRPEDGAYQYGQIDIYQPGDPLGDVAVGQLSAVAGRGAVTFVRAAAALARDGLADGIVTAPLNKAAMNQAGFHYPGHTELLAEFFGVSRYSLVLTAKRLFIFHATTHVSMREACDLLTRERVLAVVELAHRFASALNRAEETISVAGLNPHAGEGGLFGTEEANAILPALEEARRRGIPVAGPLPGDALFPKATKAGSGFVVAMYHDQGHIPFKSVFFDEGVNTTVGLPVIRTSVDHGTAFDIAGQGIAREASMLTALELAAQLAPRWGSIWDATRGMI